MKVVLQNGSEQEISELSDGQLDVLHWEQERAFAQAIKQSERGSQQRADAFRIGYDTVTKILACRNAGSDGQLTMGLSPRHIQLVLHLLQQQRRRRGGRPQPRFFEIGYGSGAVLKTVARTGCRVAGIEVSSHMRQQACRSLPAETHGQLLVGDLLAQDITPLRGNFDVVYWNDVFEHLPPGESLDYLRRIRDMLSPGGVLLTVTPNWHTRPSDVTADYRPPRSEPEGFHLKEYTLREMARLLREAGFQKVETPLAVSPHRALLGGDGLLRWKCRFEPWLERLPFTLADLLVRGLGLNTTIARC